MVQPEVPRIIGVGGCRLISVIYNDNTTGTLFSLPFVPLSFMCIRSFVASCFTGNTRKSPKDAWAKVHEVMKGKAKRAGEHETFNTHYAAISTDNNYRAPRLKLTAPDNLCLVTEMDVFQMLDTLHPTATGLD